jgi:CheY-like chemotaxis protein
MLRKSRWDYGKSLLVMELSTAHHCSYPKTYMLSFYEQLTPFRIVHVTPETGANRLMEELLQLDSSVMFEHIATGISAVKELKQRPECDLPNLIISAWWLPFLTGTDFVKQIKSDKRLSIIPLIVFDSDLPAGEAVRLYDAGANAVVQDVGDLDMYSRFAERFRAFWLGAAVLPMWGRSADVPGRPSFESAALVSRESF